MDLSILIASNRDFEPFLNKTLLAIYCLPEIVEYEILICSHQKISGPKIRWFRDKHESGSVSAYNFLFTQSKGNYIIVQVDDMIPSEQSLFMPIFFLKSSNFIDRKLKICNFSTSCRYEKFSLCEGKELSFNNVPFPCAEKKTIEQHMGGYLFSPYFFHHHCDNWLGYWLEKQGEPILSCPNTRLLFCEEATYDCYDEQDLNALRNHVKAIEILDKKEYVPQLNLPISKEKDSLKEYNPIILS